MKINIFIAIHKPFSLPKGLDQSIYRPFQVGVGPDIDPTYLRENNGDNIAAKNPYYCELTLLYYSWKNISCDILGLVHYRRYFYLKHKKKKILGCNIPWRRFYLPLSKAEIVKILSEYDIILPKISYISNPSIKAQYQADHHIQDWYIVKDIIKKRYPAYLPEFEQVENGTTFYSCNMFIAQKSTVTPYFEWLFDILFEAEKRIDLSTYSDYQKRVFGFLSERLFTVWLLHHKNRLKYYEAEMKFIENNH